MVFSLEQSSLPGSAISLFTNSELASCVAPTGRRIGSVMWNY